MLVLLHTDCAPVAAGRRKAMTLVLPGAPLSPSGSYLPTTLGNNVSAALES